MRKLILNFYFYAHRSYKALRTYQKRISTKKKWDLLDSFLNSNDALTKKTLIFTCMNTLCTDINFLWMIFVVAFVACFVSQTFTFQTNALASVILRVQSSSHYRDGPTSSWNWTTRRVRYNRKHSKGSEWYYVANQWVHLSFASLIWCCRCRWRCCCRYSLLIYLKILAKEENKKTPKQKPKPAPARKKSAPIMKHSRILDDYDDDDQERSRSRSRSREPQPVSHIMCSYAWTQQPM